MSDMNNGGWPFAEDTSDEGLDYRAIFGGGAAASDTNPFDIPAAQAEKTANHAHRDPAQEIGDYQRQADIPLIVRCTNLESN